MFVFVLEELNFSIASFDCDIYLGISDISQRHVNGLRQLYAS